MEERIRLNKQSLVMLRDLQERMKRDKVFDQEDLGWVDLLIRETIKANSKLRKVFASKQNLYEKTFFHLSKTLEARKLILEEADGETGVLGHHPNLLKLFAAKQADLTQMLKEMENELERGVSDKD